MRFGVEAFQAADENFIFPLMTPHNTAQGIDTDLLEILRCPLTRSRLRPEGEFLVAEVGGLAYPIRDGIPVMLIEEAKLPAGISSLDELKQKLKGQIPD
jgi:uncharacterized protein YbaR (Trm112 family)